MKLYADKLDAHLAKSLAPCYLLHGDEPLQIMEAGDKIRAQTRNAGFEERSVFHPTDESDWAAVRESMDSLSLFADRRVIEVRLPTGKPGRVGGEVFKQYANAPSQDLLLLITSGKLDRSATNSAWFKSLDKVGVTLAVYSLSANQLLPWLRNRLLSQGLDVEPQALSMLVERVEGNMLAARQEVERLSLLYPQGKITQEQVLDSVANSARYSIADLSQAALNGQARRALNILSGLQNEAVAEVLILFGLAQEIRAGARAAESVEAGVATDKALKSAGVWQSRAGPLRQALNRHNSSSWLSMLALCSRIDRQIKGQSQGAMYVSPWDAFSALVVCLAGTGKRPIEKHPEIPL
ncbi:MAG: DNA polymerase III subunit delta [Granulosicoccus sp.]|nr:DNA polymerase III subunit delta [Granulosicoccus sp.]